MISREELLIYVAMQYLNIKEEPGNSGQLINRFQKTCGTSALNQPWCVSFIQYVIKETEGLYDFINQTSFQKTRLKNTPNAIDLFNTAPEHLFLTYPTKYSLVIWQEFEETRALSSGHVGLIYRVQDKHHFSTIEANTSNPTYMKGSERNGEGIYLKERTSQALGSLRIKGYLKIW